MNIFTSINRAIIFVTVTNLICLCFSGSAIAYSRYNDEQLYRDYDIDSATISRLYQPPAAYLWIEKQRLKDQAYQALEFMADSASHGLNPDDYHFDLLQQFASKLDKSDVRLFELALSDGLVKLLRDMSVGRLDPTIVDPKWTIPRISFNAVEFLQYALSTNQFKTSLDSLIPASKQYLPLKASAAHYQVIISHGGWGEIPETSDLQQGNTHPNISAIRNRLAFEDDTIEFPRPSKLDHYDKELKLSVQNFQRRHSLPADGIVGRATLRAMNVSAAERLQQIIINMERLRWLPNDLGKRYIMVNSANYKLTAIEDDKVKLDMRVIVGKTKRSTPSFSSQITHIVINPHWYIPNKLARLDLLPKQQRNPNYFGRYNIRVFDTVDGNKTEINPDTVDWQSVPKWNFPYSLVQEPGKRNALGHLKFVLPNPWKIYLHDTPSKSLFKRNKRNFSAGCIRVEDPIALAGFSLGDNNSQQSLKGIISSKESYSRKLEQPLSVYVIYATVWHNGDEVVFSPDSYRRDKKMAKYL